MDDHSTEQNRMLQAYHFGSSGHDEPSGSISPFVPCASGRVPAVLRAARLTAADCFWDLGCGDGRLCHQAASQYGCQCVGVEIVEACVAEAKARATEQQLDAACKFAVCDLTALQPGALRPDGGDPHASLGSACADKEAQLLKPTVVMLFITSHGLSRLKGWLRDEWARGGLRIVTCVERLDTCFDFEAEDPLFGDESDGDGAHKWPVYAAHERHGVFVVPPLGTSLDEWAASEAAWSPRAPPTPAEADSAYEPLVLHGLLEDAEMERLCALGEEALHAQAAGAPDAIDLFDASAATTAEDYFHNSADNCEHRVGHLHRDGLLQLREGRLLEKVLAAVRGADAARWRLLVNRTCSVRSAEYHSYGAGGSVSDPEHRDQGSLLTLTVLLSPPEECEAGGVLHVARSADANQPLEPVALARGDGCLFASEKRHNVTRLAGRRRSFVVELWEGPPNDFNRHR